MSRTYPYPTDNAPATPPTGQTAPVACPCSCGHTYTRVNLRTHLTLLCEARTAEQRRQYTRLGMSAACTNHACNEIRHTFDEFYTQACAGTVPDWRNSDGLRGYADRTVRYVPAEVDQ